MTTINPPAVVRVQVQTPPAVRANVAAPGGARVLLSQPSFIRAAIAAPEPLRVALSVGQGPAGPPGLGAFGIPFAFGDATPVDLGRYSGVVVAVSIVVLTAFDGEAPELAIVAPPHVLMDATQNLASEVGRYESSPGVRLESPTTLELHLTPGVGATAGSGIVYLEVVA